MMVKCATTQRYSFIDETWTYGIYTSDMMNVEIARRAYELVFMSSVILARNRKR